jgi:hypothetical protein
MLASGFILLLTVTLPHHHHESGEICVFLWDNGDADDGEDEHQCCACNGHTIAFNSVALHKHASETHDDLALILIPLYTLFDYIKSPLPVLNVNVPDTGKTLYAESLYSVWMPVAAGFRAPPLC